MTYNEEYHYELLKLYALWAGTQLILHGLPSRPSWLDKDFTISGTKFEDFLKKS